MRQRRFKVLRQKVEDVAAFFYRPGKCTRDYRVVPCARTSRSNAATTSCSRNTGIFYITNHGDDRRRGRRRGTVPLQPGT